MEIKSQLEHKGKAYNVTYHDWDPDAVTGIGNKTLDGVHSLSFYGDKLVIVSKEGTHWTPPGGGIEKGETVEEASIREIKEESNMKVLHQECIGYQDVERIEDGVVFRQFRMMAIVEPYGDFIADPDGDIFHIKLIDPIEYKKYIQWGEIGDRLMERALEMKSAYAIKQTG